MIFIINKKKKMKNKDNLIWIDCEFTGLDYFNNKIVEIAVLVTDKNLNILDKGLNLVIHQSDDVLENMNEWCIENFEKSGLIQKIKESVLKIEEAEKEIINYLKLYTIPKTAPLCGNSIAQDRKILFREMPKLDEYCHYRSIDVSSIKELAKRWKPEILEKVVKKKEHRALDDIKESIEELKIYKKEFFKI